MKFLVAIVLTALLSFAATLFFPWWSIAVAAFIVAIVVRQHPAVSFAAAFLALSISWGVHAAYIDVRNEHVLAGKVASILPLGGSYIVLIIVTAFIGGLVAGLAAMTAGFSHSRERVRKVAGSAKLKRDRLISKEDGVSK